MLNVGIELSATHLFILMVKTMGRFLRDIQRCWSSESTYVTDEDFSLIHAIPTGVSTSDTEGEVNQRLDYVRLTPWPIGQLSTSASLKSVVNVLHIPKELGCYFKCKSTPSCIDSTICKHNQT